MAEIFHIILNTIPHYLKKEKIYNVNYNFVLFRREIIMAERRKNDFIELKEILDKIKVGKIDEEDYNKLNEILRPVYTPPFDPPLDTPMKDIIDLSLIHI